MLDSFLKLVLLPLIVSEAAERIAEWLICKWQNKCDNQSFIFPFITLLTRLAVPCISNLLRK